VYLSNQFMSSSLRCQLSSPAKLQLIIYFWIGWQWKQKLLLKAQWVSCHVKKLLLNTHASRNETNVFVMWKRTVCSCLWCCVMVVWQYNGQGKVDVQLTMENILCEMEHCMDTTFKFPIKNSIHDGGNDDTMWYFLNKMMSMNLLQLILWLLH
jgi:hypothetical protein